MKTYTCKGCNYSTTVSSNMLSHLNKRTKCSLFIVNYANNLEKIETDKMTEITPKGILCLVINLDSEIITTT